MYVVLLFMVVGYAALYSSFIGGCLGASLFLMLIISILVTKGKCSREVVLFQKEKEDVVVGNYFSIYGELEHKEFSKGYEIRVKYETSYYLQDKKKKKTVHTIVPKGEERFLSFHEKMDHVDFIKIHIKKVQFRDATGTLWLNCNGGEKITFVSMVQPVIYPLVRMDEKFSDFQEQQWDSFEIKEYQRGDKLSRIHWKLLASKQTLFIKNLFMEEEESVRILFEQPKRKEVYEVFYTVLYSVSAFFTEYQIPLVMYCNGNEYIVQKIDDVNQMLCSLFINDFENNNVYVEYDYKISVDGEMILLQSSDISNEISIHKPDEIKDIRL
ncbi:MAG: DUF58 domain-containing protein [Anaerostipes sp.]|nr:DUF58 domain-containing protein [Anaerostipes sp.]